MFTIIRLLILVGILFLQGCLGAGIEIYDFNSDENVKIKPKEGYREIVIHINDEDKSFLTIQRIGNSYLLRKISFTGEVLKEYKASNMKFNEGYCDDSYYAVTPDGNYIVHFVKADGSLYGYDISQDKDNKIIDNSVIPYISSVIPYLSNVYRISNIEYMFFINKDELFIALNAREEKKIGFFKFNIITKKVTMLRKLAEISREYCYLKEKNYLLYMEDSIRGNVYIMDINANKIIGEIPTNNGGMISCFDINKSGTKVVYMENNSVKIFDIKTKQIKVILRFDSDKVDYLVKFIANDRILYRRGEPGSLFRDVVIIDNQGKKVKKLNILINGSTYIVDDGNKMIAETGF